MRILFVLFVLVLVAASVRGAYDFYLFFHRFGIVEPLAEVRL
jgi:hypothetical protein